MFTRDCGCAYEVLGRRDFPEEFRARLPKNHAPVLTRFSTRCERHATMCRPLEDWELDNNQSTEGDNMATAPETILMDRRGIEWGRALEYQDHTPGGEGWLLMESSDGQRETYADVVDMYGYRDNRVDGKPYLIGYLA